MPQTEWDETEDRNMQTLLSYTSDDIEDRNNVPYVSIRKGASFLAIRTIVH